MSRNRCAAFNTDSNRHKRVCACRRGLLDSIFRWGRDTGSYACTPIGRQRLGPQVHLKPQKGHPIWLFCLLSWPVISPDGLQRGLMLDNAVKAGRRFRPFQMSFNWQTASRPKASPPKMKKATCTRTSPALRRWSRRGPRPVIRNIRRRRLLPPCLTLYAQQAAPSAIWCLRPAPASGISALLEMWPSG